MKSTKQLGFTLIEIILALTIIAIALTALLKVTAQNVVNTQRLEEKNSAHWVAMQGILMLQTGLLAVKLNQEVSESTLFLNKRWYWRATVHALPATSIQKIKIAVSKHPNGPVVQSLTAYRYEDD